MNVTEFLGLTKNRLLARGCMMHLTGSDHYPGKSSWVSMRFYTEHQPGNLLVELIYEAGDPGYEPCYDDTRWSGRVAECTVRVIGSEMQPTDIQIEQILQQWSKDLPNPWLQPGAAIAYSWPLDTPQYRLPLPFSERTMIQHLAACYAVLSWKIHTGKVPKRLKGNILLRRLGAFIKEQNENLVRVNGH